MQNYKQRFFELALRKGNLRFGEFTLKSGRLSPYFFNAGGFDDGESLGELAKCYAGAITDSGVDFDMLFGPAYKGIPLAAATAVALVSGSGRNVSYAYNRKEAKDHGEGGTVVGAALAGRVLIIDDVISAGTSVRESLNLINDAGATVAGVAIALDRQERGQGKLSATMELTREHGIPCIAIATLDDLIEFLSDVPGDGKMATGKAGQSLSDQGLDLDAMKRYRERYGA
ncbi:MAG TPA: orotate phosphoribosyltransferase [Xanthomonadales bacterium]|nr:orotate phosphoribosyltransferase [Xanthomonadales bacterium]